MTAASLEKRDLNGTRLVVVLALLALLAPLCLTPLPPLLDYPNHYARLWLLAGGMDAPPLSEMYAVDWARASLNIGVDLIAATFGPLVGKALIPTLILGLAIILAPLAGILLHRRIFGGFHWWQIAFSLPAWSMTLLAGFMNFHIGLGLAMLAAALDDRIARLPLPAAFIARALLCALVLTCHPFAGLFYAGLIIALSFGRDLNLRSLWPDLKAKVPPVLLAALAAVAPVLLLVLLSRNAPVGAVGDNDFFKWVPFSIAKRISVLSSGMRSYSMAVDALALLALVALPAVALLQRRLSLHAGLLILSVAFAILACLMPTRIGGTFWMDYRLPIMALFAFLLAVKPDIGPSKAAAALAACVLLVLSFTRTAIVANYWLAAQSDIASVRQALSDVPAGAAVLTLVTDPAEAEQKAAPHRYPNGKANFWNYGALAVPWRQAFAPNLFSANGQQPLRIKAPWEEISTPVSPPLTIEELTAQKLKPHFSYAKFWRTRFDYVLLLNADMPDAERRPLPAGFQLIRDDGFARLFRIRRPALAEAK